MFQFRQRIGLSPGLRLLEREALSVNTRAAAATVRAGSAIQDAVTPQAYQGAARLIPQWGQEAVVAILGIGYDEVQLFKYLLLPMAAQLFDLLYAHLNIRLRAECPSDGNRESPTVAWFRHPCQHGVWMTDHDRSAVDGGRGTEDVLPVSQAPRRWMRPSRTIQGKQLGALRWDLLDEMPLQPCPILAAPLNGGVTAVPLATEGWQKTQLGKGTDRPAEK
jgi:hypothetical protein